jgi:hypothetical protein
MLVKIKFNYNPKIKNEIINFQKYFYLLLKAVNMPKSWSDHYAFHLEVKKSFIRGMLRYSKHSIRIQKILIDLIRKETALKLNYISPIYPMIHLPHDKVEAGGFHYDDYSMKIFRTVWLPLTKYRYSSLSIFKFQNFIIDILAKIILKTRLPKIFSNKIFSKPGDFYLWDGKRIHAGNINKSSQISCAFQMKLSSDVYIYEPSRNINKFNKYNNKNFINFRFSDLKKIYNVYQKNINLFKKKLNFTNKTINFNNIYSKPISFAYSVLAQRLLSSNKYFGLENYKDLSNQLDLLSILNGGDNLISYLRLSKQIKLKKKLKSLNLKNTNKPVNLINSYQVNKILNKNISNKNKIYNY